MLDKTLESPLDGKEIKPVNRKENQSLFIGRTDAKAETLILWPPDVKNWLLEKDSDAGKDWRQEEKGTTEDEMVGWHHQLNGHEFEITPGVGEGLGSLACCIHGVAKSRTWLSDWIDLGLVGGDGRGGMWENCQPEDWEKGSSQPFVSVSVCVCSCKGKRGIR